MVICQVYLNKTVRKKLVKLVSDKPVMKSIYVNITQAVSRGTQDDVVRS